ncbi:uncharacterized protein FOMMEDRAFT_144813 [Fomitiporia mediterranea MF3/22]|uniref:uncharacterized protein n=1 Tax=Fomitiporia mediterranea (strain MF3/22) TaxID=694068 RepID=UPI0004409BA3|nr:uncharacterized protein FOMMEDRAFT_144813 [Fomitiporia mediterranea MF3/22]EJD07007.1 hypothetical protein FOMMEDRAFT_144813 [Fomitiporia mediterranea MF3/22]
MRDSVQGTPVNMSRKGWWSKSRLRLAPCSTSSEHDLQIPMSEDEHSSRSDGNRQRRKGTNDTLVGSPADKQSCGSESPLPEDTKSPLATSPTSYSPLSSPFSPKAALPTLPYADTTSLAPSPTKPQGKDCLRVKRSGKTDDETFESMRASALLIARTIANFAEATNIPYLKGLAGLSSLIFDYADGVAANKEHCSRIINNVAQLLVAINERTVEAGGKRSEALEDQASRLKTSLEAILRDVRRLSDRNRSYFRKFILMERDKEIIQRCDEELKFAMNMFSLCVQLRSSIEIQTCIPNMLCVLERIEDRLRGIERRSAGSKRLDSHGLLHEHHDKDKQRQETFKDAYNGSNLRPAPAIFCGRSDVLEELVRRVSRPTAARIAILGPGGIGKTSLALKLLHHEDVARRYAANRFFVPCDSAVSAESVVSLIASNIHFPQQWESVTVRPGQTETEVLAHLRGSTSDSQAKDGSQTPTILILDNFESPWERNRTEVEQLLARLAALENVTLVITLRGVEHPCQVKWDQPMLPPLQTLDPQPAREMFLSISGTGFSTINESETDELDELLTLCDYLPLAIQLMAGLAVPGMDTVPGLVRRWKRTKQSTAMLSDGEDSGHSLEISIELSLGSPRMKRVPEAHTLLAVLAMLPDGIRDDDLEIAIPDFEKLEKSRLVLLKTSLVYIDEASGRLKMLAPIRAYIASCDKYFPQTGLVKSLEDYFWTFIQYAGTDQNNEDKVKRALPELGNIESLVNRAFSKDIHLDSAAASAVKLAQFVLQASLGKPCLTQLQRALSICKQRQNKKLEADCNYTITLCNRFFPVVGTDTAENDILRVLSLYEDLDDKMGQGHCHHQLGCLYHSTRQLECSRTSFEKAFQCHLQAGCLHGQAYALLSLARVLHIMNETEPALQRANDSLQILRTKCHVPMLEAQCFEFLGYIHFQTLCKYMTAAELFEESLRIYKALSLEECANCMNTTVSAGELAYSLSQYDDAKDVFQRAATIYRRTKRRDREAYALIKLGLAYIGLNAVDDAFTSIRAGLDIWEELKIHGALEGASEDAEEHYAKALQSFRADSTHWKTFEADALLKLGILFIRTDRESRARDSIQNSSRLYKEAASRRGETDCLRQLTELDLRHSKGTKKRDALTRLESVEKDYSDMGLYVERQECAVVIAQTYRILGAKQPKNLYLQI